jgi:glutamate-1-semialdehyde 2,1-aminomutase
MGGLVLAPEAPRNSRDAAERIDHERYVALAQRLNDLGILCEPDSWEPWFVCAAHDDACLKETLEKFERAVAETPAS